VGQIDIKENDNGNEGYVLGKCPRRSSSKRIQITIEPVKKLDEKSDAAA
jgi:hypothetical protein